LILTLIVSSANRTPKIIKEIINPDLSFNNALQKKGFKAKYISLQSSKNPEEILTSAEKAFRKNFGKPIEDIGGKTGFLFYSKNSIFRISPTIAHLGAIVILAGVMLSAALGYRSYTNIKVGQTIHHSYLLKNNKPVLLPFKIKLDNYVTKYYKNGTPKAYISTLTVMKKHISILTKTIRVNHPLTYDGITIYQASFGHYKPTAARILVLNLKNKNKKVLLHAVPGKIYNSKINNIKFSFNFFKKPKKNQIPFYISIIKNNKKVGPPLKFKEYSIKTKKGNMPLIVTKYSNNIAFIFTGVKTYYYSGVEITKNVDTYIVWIGSAILIFALFFSFFFNQQSLWIRVTPSEKDKTNIIEILSIQNKKFASFYSMIDKNVAEFKKNI
ncbi:MAG: cytochrome c biogenesis protein ResB, partial [bacterium]